MSHFWTRLVWAIDCPSLLIFVGMLGFASSPTSPYLPLPATSSVGHSMFMSGHQSMMMSPHPAAAGYSSGGNVLGSGQSPTLRDGLGHIQDVHAGWWQHFSEDLLSVAMVAHMSAACMATPSYVFLQFNWNHRSGYYADIFTAFNGCKRMIILMLILMRGCATINIINIIVVEKVSEVDMSTECVGLGISSQSITQGLITCDWSNSRKLTQCYDMPQFSMLAGVMQ